MNYVIIIHYAQIVLLCTFHFISHYLLPAGTSGHSGPTRIFGGYGRSRIVNNIPTDAAKSWLGSV